MASIFKRAYKRPVPPSAEIITRKGERLARWKSRGRTKTAPLDDTGAFVVQEMRCWYIGYLGADGQPCQVKGFTDKEATERKARELEDAAARERAGLVVASEAMAMEPIGRALDAWIGDLTSAGRDGDYVYNMRLLMGKLVEHCPWPTLAAVRADTFEAFRTRLRTVGLPKGKTRRTTPKPVSGRTLNGYLDTANAFLNFCVGRHWIRGNPLAVVKKADQSDQRRVRRSFTPDELRRLFAKIPAYRRLAYLTAALSGLRQDELRQLEWGDVVIDTPAPFFRLRAKATKARRSDALDMHPDLVTEFRAAKPADAQPGDRVFKTVPKWATFKKDVEAAGIAYYDDQGRQADFHALRHTFGTSLAKAGVSIREAMLLMRHTDIRLTTKVYVDAGLLDTRGALAKLPGVPTSSPEQTATGTH